MADVGQVLQFFANGVVFGSILALGAIGLTLVYGILRLANFAHGDFVALGAFVSFLAAVAYAEGLTASAAVCGLLLAAWIAVDTAWLRLLTTSERIVLGAFSMTLLASALTNAALPGGGSGTTNLRLVVATLVAVAVVGGFVVLLEFAVWRPLRRRHGTVLTLIITSIGVALVARNLLLLRFGGGLYSYDRPTAVAGTILGVQISNAQLFALFASLALMGLVHAFLKYTRAGKAMRALSDNRDLARASGVDVDRIIVYVWAFGGALTAVAGVLLSLAQNSTMNANMGFFLILPLFAAVILGGVGSPYGAIGGAFLVGIGMKTSVLWLGSQYELAAAFLLLIVVLLIRPQGLFGGRPA